MPTKMAIQKLTENALKGLSQWISRGSGPLRPCEMKWWRKLQMQWTTRLSKSISALQSRWVWLPTCKLMCYIRINDIPPILDAIGVNSATPEWSPAVLYDTKSCNIRSGCSQCGPKSSRVPSDDQHFPEITPANTDDGLCLDLTLYKYIYKIAGILWPADYRWSTSRTKLHVVSQRDYNYNPKSPRIPIPIWSSNLNGTKPQWQSPIEMMKSLTGQWLFKLW